MSSIFAICALLAAVPSPLEMRGPFPIMSTPYFCDGSVDYDGLAREVRWVADSGCPGVIWCQSNDAVDLLTTGEKFAGFEACAKAAEGLGVVLALGANGTNATEMLEIAAEIERVAERHPAARIAMISRPPDDVRSQEGIEAAWDALGKVAKRPVIFQTYGTKETPTPSIELIVRLAERHPRAFGYVKEEAAGWEANERMMKEREARPPLKAIFAGWGGWQWLLQLRHCGSEGLVTERCAYAPILGEIWRRYERGERGRRLTEAFAMYRLLIDQRNFPEGLRGYSLYLLNKAGVFRNMVSRQYEKADVTEGGSFGAGRKWKLETVELNDIQKAELDLLYAEMMEFSSAVLGAHAASSPEIDPLTTRWTFGAYEPYSMYRRMGKKSTGGIDGSAKWLGDWLDWWDEKAPETMRELGLNGLHSRFYKGMGWETEKKDFPNVKKFVRNCHANGVTALAYVQFSTLYFEPMRAEIPDLDDWAQVDEHGEKRLWNNYYFRWMPCITCEEWQAYIERICEIALMEGGFDGIMFDNAFVHPCYCGRCERKFAEHLASIQDPEARFGFAGVSGIRQPRPTEKTDSKDPVYQEWVRWRVGLMNSVMARFRRKIKSVKPDAVVSANAQPFRASGIAAKFSLEMVSFSDFLDLLMMQSDTFPGYDAKTGIVSNRVRDLKIASELGKPIVALCDGNAGQYDLDESEYMRPLVEDLIWKGIPTDRTVMSPVRTPGFIDRARAERRKPMLAGLNALAEKHREQLSAPSYCPVRIFYPSASIVLSKAAHNGVTAAEEILLRNHVPFGYSMARGLEAPAIPDDCEVLVVANQEWLSDAQIAGVAGFAKRGGHVVVTGESGLWDEHGAQRFENPLRSALADVPTAVWRDVPDVVGGSLGWVYRVEPPKDGGKALMDDIAKTGWRPKVRVENLPPYVFTEVKKTQKGYAVFFLNYNPSERVSGAKVFFDSECADIPAFDLYWLQVE